ncbi:MAG: DUF1365 domain-containing protein [Acidobacteria bacterium]|nr:DUF1365 domain-containing protein [Acidobacteriota bacterium]
MRDSLGAGVYSGRVRHRRLSPVEHNFEYTMFMAYLDVDRIPELMSVSRWAGYEKAALVSFRESDHFGDPSLPLRKRLEQDAAASGVMLPDGPIYLLTHLRYAGYCFNPISLYYFYSKDGGEPKVVMAEVHSTFGESHNYWLPGLRADGVTKELHVSPFNTMDNEYGFRLTAPAANLVAHIDSFRKGQKFFDATLTLDWMPWTAKNLKRSIFAYPFMTVKVIAAIHWQALQLFFKRMPFVPHPSKL